MILAFMICQATYGSGVRIGMTIRVAAAFCVGALGTSMRSTVAYLTATGTTPATATPSSAFTSPSVHNKKKNKKNFFAMRNKIFRGKKRR